MKKVLALILAAVLLLAIGTVGVFAARGNFTDENNDGICDNRPVQVSENKGTGYVDDNADGVCDNFTEDKPLKNCKGTGYVDENEDGVCDNFTEDKPLKNCKGTGYVDEDEDGVCDNFTEDKPRYGCGMQQGCGRQGQGKGKCSGQGR